MTAGRMMTALSALALGLATAGAVPALAQQGAASTGTTAPGSAATSEHMNNAPAATSNPAATTGANTAASTSNAPSNAPMATGQANATTSTETHAQKNAQRNTESARQHMNTKSKSAEMTHQPVEHHRRTARRSTHINNANPNAQNAEVARLNEQSLQAAQQGRTFTPSSNM